jgi:glycosyltransferase involved in cell wall biosynthesis
MTDYSIIVPAYNEEAYLPQTLASISEAMNASGLAGEIVVVDNNSRDRTGDIAAAFGARVVFEPLNQIARARNTGARAADGRYLVFVDADTTISPELLRAALSGLAGGRVAGGGATVSADRRLEPLARKMLAGWNGYSRRFHIAAGSFVYCLRPGFEAVGGFDQRVYASEEIWFSMRLKRWARRRGKTFVVLDAYPVVTSARKLDWFSSARLLAATLIVLLFPFAVFNRRLCGIWYDRPREEGVASRPKNHRG